jgi:hypothetical protein
MGAWRWIVLQNTPAGRRGRRPRPGQDRDGVALQAVSGRAKPSGPRSLRRRRMRGDEGKDRAAEPANPVQPQDFRHSAHSELLFGPDGYRISSEPTSGAVVGKGQKPYLRVAGVPVLFRDLARQSVPLSESAGGRGGRLSACAQLPMNRWEGKTDRRGSYQPGQCGALRGSQEAFDSQKRIVAAAAGIDASRIPAGSERKGDLVMRGIRTP